MKPITLSQLTAVVRHVDTAFGKIGRDEVVLVGITTDGVVYQKILGGDNPWVKVDMSADR